LSGRQGFKLVDVPKDRLFKRERQSLVGHDAATRFAASLGRVLSTLD
jgi:hypothetical protein